MRETLELLKETYPGHVREESFCHGELCASAPAEDGPQIAGSLVEKGGARLAMLFAEDRLSAEGVFYNYYVFDRPGGARFLILRTPIPCANARFLSLAGRLPAVNWQEREIQDWFGIEAEGHPN